VVVAVDEGGVTSGVGVAGAGAGVAEGAGIGFTGGAAATGGGVAVDGVEGTAPTELWAGAAGAGAMAPVFTPLVAALGVRTERSGEATVVERLRVTTGASARSVVVTR
jgi:hypothetical protein